MERAIDNLKQKTKNKKQKTIDCLIIDGNFKLDNVDIPQRSMIKADEKVFSVAAASIIAKVTRDRLMRKYHKKYPQYSFDKNVGYLTKYHQQILKRYGKCVIHRNSFKY